MSPSTAQEYCGLGIRGVSMTIDAFVWFLAFLVAAFGVGAVAGEVQTTAIGREVHLDGAPAVGAFALFLALGVAYHALLEWRYGRTIGKHLVAIRVRESDGSPLSFRASLVRNALRLVDFLPLFYLVGIATLTTSDRKQRLGDRVADTVVVRS